MLPFGVTIPATVPQGSEILAGLTSNPVFRVIPKVNSSLVVPVFKTMLLDIPNCLITSVSRVLPEKLAGPRIVKKFPAFYGTRKFITALTSFRHLYLT